MSAGTSVSFAQPITVSAGQPLRVAVYARLADAIRGDVFPLGSLLPNESELGSSLGVSRTVVREALMLLEEDGLIVTKRGVGRSVVNTLPTIGLEQFRPFEEVLATPDTRLRIVTREFVRQPTTDFVSGGLSIDSGANTWFRESVAFRDDEPIAIVQEHLPAGRYLSDINAGVAARIGDLGDREGTLLTILIEDFGHVFGPGECDVAVGVAGQTRGRILGLRANDPVLILTQRASYSGTPIYLAKCIISHSAGHLTVIQSSSS
jgi:GntR family transcriptional regulator